MLGPREIWRAFTPQECEIREQVETQVNNAYDHLPSGRAILPEPIQIRFKTRRHL